MTEEKKAAGGAPSGVSDSTQLLGCPFCGSDNLEYPSWLAQEAGWKYGVSCSNCGATSYSVKDWNTRVHPNAALTGGEAVRVEGTVRGVKP
jgi:hypothetical protein